MKNTIFLLDKGKHRKFIVDIDLRKFVEKCASDYMDHLNSDRKSHLELPLYVDVKEADNTVVHPKITPRTNYVKLACDLEVGDIIPFAQTCSGKEVIGRFASLNIIVECCPLPKDISGFGAVRVVKMDR